MKKITSILLLVFAFVYASAQDLDYAKQVIRTLASEKFSGRGYADKGNILAAEYIKDQFVKVGLKPFGKNYFQPFNIDVNVFPSTMKFQIDGTELIPGKDYLIDPASPSLKGEYDVHVIKKQDLLDESLLNNAVKLSAGKVLIIDATGFATDDDEKKQKARDQIRFLKTDPKVQSAAVIVYTDETLMWNISKKQISRPVFTVGKKLNLTDVRKVKINVKSKLINYETENVIGYIEGKEQPDSFLVMLAHYDHLGKMGADTYFPGANDNASGVAMLLNMAKYFSENPPRYSIAFIALSAEEIGIVGARYYVDHPLFDLDKIKFLVNFDMTGTGDKGIMVVNGSVYTDKFDMLTKINESKGYLQSVQIRGAACNSDHCPFYEKGVPGFFIYTLGGTQAYHDINDRYDLLPLTAFVNYAKLMIDFFDQLK